MILELGAGHRFDVTHRALVMGILNRTPDSFFDGGQYFDMDGFLAKAESLVADGADFLDVGGVKAGPGPEVSTEEELERVVPAVEALHARFDVPSRMEAFFIENPVAGRLTGLLATHPPIEARIDALRRYAGAEDTGGAHARR